MDNQSITLIQQMIEQAAGFKLIALPLPILAAIGIYFIFKNLLSIKAYYELFDYFEERKIKQVETHLNVSCLDDIHKAPLQLMRIEQVEIFLTGLLNQKHRKLLIPLLVTIINEGYKPTSFRAFKENLSEENSQLVLKKNVAYYLMSVFYNLCAAYLLLVSLLFLPLIYHAWASHSVWQLDTWLGFGAYGVIVVFTVFLIFISVTRHQKFKKLQELLQKIQNPPATVEHTLPQVEPAPSV